MTELTHIDASGQPRMVNVSDKPATKRTARARGQILFPPEAWKTVQNTGSAKGNIESVARIAGIMAAKNTANTIPLCHGITLTGIHVSLVADNPNNAFDVSASVTTTAQTGVEMEALAAVSAALLAVYDMTKAICHDMVISNIALEQKCGGNTGHYHRSNLTETQLHAQRR